MTEHATDARIAVVTGASRGIGRAVAIALAKAGHHIVALARTQGALDELDDEIRALGGSATLVPLDLTDGPAIDRLGLSLYERYGRVDVLVGNAGVLGPLSPLGHVDPRRFDEVMAVNVTANWRLIRSLDPLLRQSAAGRAVFMTSGAAHKCRAYWGPYAISKAALEAMVRTYAAETQNTSAVTANLFNPGPLRTRMRAQAMPGEDPMTLRTPEDAAPWIVRMVEPGETRTGLLFDFPTEDWLVPQLPLPEA
ncbi:SDR family NAD(P)-dependent oxidoreductase [Methylobrevis albus]|uniref:SDR family NAD(P)-dependent oxidoreductase n=1 Tax=Methylobrevis albus TaxID=2793297 RepID=A0A931N141_9HYPH|nr:SDR family NAD(P)-dependent oxidoreductase [Methylobrevis albus]MBH0239904.1 SDR family NAD(P)-dependent oxidoreductase [Methylobrevis albus]